MKVKIQAIDHHALSPGILKANITKFEALSDRTGSAKRIRLRADCRLHLEERQQIGQEKGLIGNAGEGREDLLDVAAGLHNGSNQEIKGADGQPASHSAPDYVSVRAVISASTNDRQHRADSESFSRQLNILLINNFRKLTESFGEKAGEIEKLKLLCSFLGGPGLA